VGVSKATIFKGKYEAKLKFPGGVEGSKQKSIPTGGGKGKYGYFVETCNTTLWQEYLMAILTLCNTIQHS